MGDVGRPLDISLPANAVEVKDDLDDPLFHLNRDMVARLEDTGAPWAFFVASMNSDDTVRISTMSAQKLRHDDADALLSAIETTIRQIREALERKR